MNFQRNICEQIREQIIDCIIRKSQIRTQKRHFEQKSEKITINKDDFCPLLYFTGKPSIWLCFNSKDQYLYVLKMFVNNNPILQNQYNHEISFYTESNNENSVNKQLDDKVNPVFEKMADYAFASPTKIKKNCFLVKGVFFQDCLSYRNR